MFTTSPPSSRAIATARSDLPAAVAPTTETTRGGASGRAEGEEEEPLTSPVSQNPGTSRVTASLTGEDQLCPYRNDPIREERTPWA
ncbi:hypothetical protein Kpho02_53900 [Kitasatospora phosalacinea]|uniref:Uncharacterized protein n=1 Tax=Kitasatospora phosalacinea TaxID=2065 RepID=A0A9W6QCV5_9ACTN|nr:hypothetical protein Kpho02_53900 [Kitasatospora phosalacinea]